MIIMCGFGLQRSHGRNILELFVYYLMPNKRKNLKDMKSFCLSSVLVAFKITKVGISCIIECNSGPYCSNFITCISNLLSLLAEVSYDERNIDSESSLTFSS